MMRHLLKLVWNRKRTSALMILEIFFSFLVLFAVGTLAMSAWDNYRRPLGFQWENVWSLNIDMQMVSDDSFTQQQVERSARLLREIQSLDGVEAAAGAMMGPFSFGSYQGGMEINGRQISIEFNEVTRELAEVLGLQLVAGRWFQEGDENLAWQPVVINQNLAREVFGSADPVSKPLSRGEEATPSQRVIGVASDFRQAGELSAPGNFRFELKRPSNPHDRPSRILLVKVPPGTPAAFEERLIERAQAIAPDWSFEVTPLSRLRETAFRLRLTPLIVGGIVAFFLLLMVGLGLIGVLWQNLLQRTREIGLRRATGAARSMVLRQVLIEQLLLTTLGVLFGVLLVVQIPALDLIGLRVPVFAGGLTFALGAIYLLSILCALYPSMLAGRIQPAEALRYE